MVQVIESTHQEKIEMYRTLDKEVLIEMLIAANNMIQLLTSSPLMPKYVVYGFFDYCRCPNSESHFINGAHVCKTCNKHIDHSACR